MDIYKYNDKWFRLIGVPLMGIVIRNFGVYEPLHVALKTKQYYIDLGWNTLTVLLVWETSRYLIIYLDRHYSWLTKRLERLLLQTLLVAGISSIEVIGLTFLFNEILIKRPGSFDIGWLMVLDVPLTLVFVLLINLVYTGMYLFHYHRLVVEQYNNQLSEAYNQIKKLERLRPEIKSAELQQKKLIVNLGSSSIPITTDRIGHIYKANELCLIKTLDNKEYTSSSSLDNLEAILDNESFFRLNRQVLANVQAIRQFKPHGSGKLMIVLEPVLNEEVFVSKKRAPEFKEWLGKKI